MAQSDVIREFLVSLGFRVDQKGLGEFTRGVDGATVMVQNLVGELAKVAVAVTGATLAFASSMENVYFSAKRTGSQADSLKAFGAAAKNLGIDAGESAGSIESLAAALRNNPGNEGFLQSLGVKTRDGKWQLRDSVDLMVELGEALQKYEPAVRRQMANQFGISDNMLLALSDPRFAGELAKQRDFYQNSGLQKAAQDANEFDIKVRDLVTTMKAQLVPTMTWLVGVFNDGLAGGDSWFKKHAAEINQWKDALGAGLKAILGDIGGMIETLSGALNFYIGKIVEYADRAYRAIARIIPDSWRGNGPMAAFGEKFGWIGSGLTMTDAEMDSLKPVAGTSKSSSSGRMSTEDMMQKLMGYGWTKDQAAGIVANIMRESGGNPGAIGDSGKAYGLGQWHPDRQAAFKRFSGKDIKESTSDEQIAFMNHELTMGEDAGARRAGMLMRAQKNNAYMSGDIMSRYHERPRDVEGEAARRGASAVQIAQNTTITVNGAGDPAAVGQAVAREQRNVNADLTRNMQPVVR